MSQTSLGPVETTLARLLNSRLRSVLAPTDLTPVQITGIYTVLGFGALYFSDVYLVEAIEDPAVLAQIQALKGGVEVVLTAGLILLLTTRSRQAIDLRNRRLDTLRAERNVLHRVFRHNLRQDINIIMGYIDIIRQGTTDADLRSSCEKVLKRVEKIEQYQNKIVDIERILEPATVLKRMDLCEVVESTGFVQSLQDTDDVMFSIDLPEEAPVIASSHIQIAIGEILENARDHNTAENPKIRVSIEENSDGLVDLIVEDNGPGISAYERTALEEMREESLTHSSGLGLWLAKLVCTVSGGEFTISESADGGTKIALKLPEAPERAIQRRVTALTG
jgi:signal transduction histidine kinase